MEFLNSTLLNAAFLPGRINFPDHSLTLIVKGSFDLRHGKTAALSDVQGYPTGDEYYPDDIDMTGSLRYESDFSFFKPKADLLLAGHCHSPTGKPVQGCNVGFTVGRYSKELYVLGARHWKKGAGGNHPTDPEPFTKKELKFEYSFGGNGYEMNPVGIGFAAEDTNGTQGHQLLPCIQDPDNLVGSTKDQPVPVGFGPVGRMWQERLSKMGTYDDQWQEYRWPWFAKDLQWSYFNCAQTDMQVEGYLKGDESLSFTNLHPDHPHYEAKLPGIRVRCFVNKIPGSDSDNTNFSQVKMNLDTLWADMDAEKLVLVWRGVTDVASDQVLDIEHVYIMDEPVDEPEKELEQYHNLYLSAVLAEKQQWEDSPDTEDETSAEPEDLEITETDSVDKITPIADVEEETQEPPGDPTSFLKKQIQEASGLILAKFGVDLAALPPETKEKILSEQDKMIDTALNINPENEAVQARQKAKQNLIENLSKLDIDLDNLPSLTEKAKLEQARMMSELMGAKVTAVPAQFAEPMAIFSAVLAKAGFDLENLDDFIDKAKEQQEKLGFSPPKKPETDEKEEAEPADEEIEKPDPTPGELTRKSVAQKAQEGDSFAGKNLSGLDLSDLNLANLDFTDADFTGTILMNTNLSGAVCTNAVFEKADLTGADLTRCNIENTIMKQAILEQADLSGSYASQSDFSGAALSGANLSDAVLEQAILQDVTAKEITGHDTVFSEVTAQNACFVKSDLSGADFSNAILEKTDFSKALLFEASFEGSVSTNACFNSTDLTLLRASEGADFMGSSFSMAKGNESIWHDANLTATDFSFTKMERADFSGACMKEANLSASDMKYARFMGSDMTGARMMDMNLFQGSLERSILFNADMSNSNMYGVEFLKADIKNLRVENTNLKMTKLINA